MKITKKHLPQLGIVFTLLFSTISTGFASTSPDFWDQDSDQSQSSGQGQGNGQGLGLDNGSTGDPISALSVETTFLNSLTGFYQGTRQQSDYTPLLGITTYQDYVYPRVFTTNNTWTFRWTSCYTNGFCVNNDTVFVEKNGDIFLDVNRNGSNLVKGTVLDSSTDRLVLSFGYTQRPNVFRSVTTYDSLIGSLYTRNIVIRDNGKIVRDLYYVLGRIPFSAKMHKTAPHSKTRF